MYAATSFGYIISMRRSIRLSIVVALSAAALCAFATDDTWRKDLLAWRAKKAERLQAPGGWLAVVGLEWLKAGDNSVGSAAGNRIKLKQSPPSLGVFRLQANSIVLAAPAGGYPKDLRVDGQIPQPQHPLLADDSEKPSRITVGTLTITVIHRGERYGLRIRDTQSPARLHFTGLRWYDPVPAYRVRARWTPYTPPRQTTIPTLIGGKENVTIPGAAEFQLDGQTVRLEPVVDTLQDTELFFILRDTTSKSATYPAARFLYTGLPDHGLNQPGELLIDLNRVENPPCAYTAYATCPLPPPANKLKIAIPAGELRYHD